jgi:putative DNA methylase
MAASPRKKKLIETGIPLTTISRESAREKSLRHGLPNTLHLYWSRKPLATSRSILFAQLVDDPSSHPDKFPTPEAQEAELKRLQKLMERLAVWENRNDKDLYQQAFQAILDSNDGIAPRVLDPFAGGGSIPLEAQRLGLESYASDLNPLAVIINKALIEIPSRFCGNTAIHPHQGTLSSSHNRADGLAEDIRYYGKALRDAAFEKIGHLYPSVRDENGEERTVIAWKWARTVANPNPANPIQVPLVNSWWLSKKKGHEAWVKPIIEGNSIRYEVQHNADGPKGDAEWTIKNGRGGKSIVDGTPFSYEYVRSEGVVGQIGKQLIAVVAESNKGRLYLSPDEQQVATSRVNRPKLNSDAPIAENPRWFSPPQYGLKTFGSLFTNRQLVALTTLADLVGEVHDQVLVDAKNAGMPDGDRLDAGGNGAQAYADTISVYLALAVSRLTDRCSSIASWQNIGEKVRDVFARQAIPMTWDFAEVNPFSSSSGNFYSQVQWVAEAVENVPAYPISEAQQADAATRNYKGVVVSTDPPYYDNIGYSDLSDYFYVWLRRMLDDVLPSVTSTMLTPKAEELVANPYRHDGKAGAAEFFVDGFNHVFKHIRNDANPDVPMTVYYAYKQQDASNGTSTGWYALLDGLIRSGWEITATWPVRSERGGRLLSVGTNALASSIVLACRPRPEDAPVTTLREFTRLLRAELTSSLKTMMSSGIDPVDLAQVAIGPGISVYSRYSHIREANGSDMPIQNALEIINRTLDEVLGESDTDYDSDTRFAVKWYQSYGWSPQSSGLADQLARSTDTSPSKLERGGIFNATGGKAHLLSPKELSGVWNPSKNSQISLWEAVVRLAGILQEGQGIESVSRALAQVEAQGIPAEQIRDLGFRMFHAAEKRHDTEGALFFNGLVSSWDELTLGASKETAIISEQQEDFQGSLDLDDGE